MANDLYRLRSTPPSREATKALLGVGWCRPVAIHAPLAGGDLCRAVSISSSVGCDPRPPRGRRPRTASACATAAELRSTPPSREATSSLIACVGVQLLRSTPPSREATIVTGRCCGRHHVAIHAPLAGGDPRPVQDGRPVRVAIHAPLAGGDHSGCEVRRFIGVAIHAPLAGGDPARFTPLWTPTLVAIHAPLAGGDVRPDTLAMVPEVAIHAPLAGGDRPHPVRRLQPAVAIHAPLAGGDHSTARKPQIVRVAIHAPLAGGDLPLPTALGVHMELRSTPPSREATGGRGRLGSPRDVAIHAPLAGGDHCQGELRWRIMVAIHAPLAGGDRLAVAAGPVP